MPLSTLIRHRGRVVLATAALAFVAACGSESPAGPASPSSEANASDLMRLNLSTTSVTMLQSSSTAPLPTPFVIIASNQAALIPSTGIQVGAPVYSGKPGWLTVTPKILGLTASITVSVNPNGLPEGGYQATFTVKVPGTTNSPMTVTVFYAKGIYFQDGAEGTDNWVKSGLWHRSTLLGICNVSNGGAPCLPAPDEGTHAWWYGVDGAGDYEVGNTAGNLDSPRFAIPAGSQTPTLGFRTTWEVENLIGSYDHMEVYAVPESIGVPGSDGPEVFLGHMNGTVYAAQNRMPNYVTMSFDLSAFKGRNIKLRFRFVSGDGAGNDFRGWIVDRVLVAEPGVFTGINFPSLRADDGNGPGGF